MLSIFNWKDSLFEVVAEPTVGPICVAGLGRVQQAREGNLQQTLLSTSWWKANSNSRRQVHVFLHYRCYQLVGVCLPLSGYQLLVAPRPSLSGVRYLGELRRVGLHAGQLSVLARLDPAQVGGALMPLYHAAQELTSYL